MYTVGLSFDALRDLEALPIAGFLCVVTGLYLINQPFNETFDLTRVLRETLGAQSSTCPRAHAG
jgi:hypothetical protein